MGKSEKREYSHSKSTFGFALQRALSQIKADFESKLKFNAIYSSGTPSTQRVNTIPTQKDVAADHAFIF